MVMAVRTRSLMTLRWISSVVVTILISASRLSTFHPALTQWMNLRRIYQISIACLRPRRKHLEVFFGSILFDLIPFDSNCQRNRHRNPLPHFSLCPLPPPPGSPGVNIFTNLLPAQRNIYVFRCHQSLSLLRVRSRFPRRFHFGCYRLSQATLLVDTPSGSDCRLFTFEQERPSFSASLTFSTFSTMAPA